ncbi:hypothetical protein BT96DRAFT_956740 [Gymnopus androsaceus JB14]|uniref:rRNA-processing protein FYV7 n=1 Tax=Gymnopus androsaceus JB14 TaxID=1447944 RepID=A0A6A4HUY6_9AGAR|nr:hypothetical protein BT96DRAFT_956740 [Gymnopus androsaceus JB14]
MVVSEGHKKKKPPTFNHYPVARAKSLKKSWVEKTKIKSKWKAERRKLGLPSRSLPETNDEVPEDEEAAVEEEPSPKPHPKATHPDTPSTSTSQPKEHVTPDLRELTRKAYSRETLHTYKSDPLNQRRGTSRGRGTRGRGQPNMKLRMGAMLEKIKRDFT